MFALVGFCVCGPTTLSALGEDPGSAALVPASEAETGSSIAGIGERLLWYLPDRVLDFADIFRMRLRVGPGSGATLRATDYLHFYGGDYHSRFIGLPGPRRPHRWRSPYGREQQKGLIWFGVDATDTEPNPPAYSPTEIDIGAHLLWVGAEIGFDIVEIADFVWGLMLLDPVADDHKRGRANPPMYVKKASSIYFPAGKPATFDSVNQRLDYARTNFVAGLNEGARQFDSLFAKEESPVLAPTGRSRLRYTTYAEIREDNGVEFNVDPDFDLEVSLPNLERRWSIFVSGLDINELPGTPPVQDDDPVFIGLRKGLDDLNIKADVGVRMGWVPEAFSRVRWASVMSSEQGALMPSLSGFYETDDGLGALATFTAERWLDGGLRHTVRSTSSGRYTVDRDAWAVEQSLSYGFIPKMIFEDQRGQRGVGDKDMARGVGVRMSARADFSENTSIMERYRLTFVCRTPLYSDWVYLQVEPELEWDNAHDWDTVPILRIGIDAMFWSIGQR